MKALVVFESMFGNTETVARAIADGIAVHADVQVLEVGAAPAALDRGIGLVVVGGPTHAFGMSRSTTRKDAAEKSNGPLVSAGDGLREWLSALAAPAIDGPTRVAAAAFDTHIDKSWVPGSAAKAAGRRLRRLGFWEVASPESFYVEDVVGPLGQGEAERARDWGRQLIQHVLQALRA